MLRLIFSGNDSRIKQNRIDAWPITIGADQSNSIEIHDKTVAAAHAEIVSTDSGPCIVDLRSGCRTRVNGRCIQHAIIRPGNAIRFGEVIAQVEMESNALRKEPSRLWIVDLLALVVAVLCSALIFIACRDICDRAKHLGNR